MHTSWSPGSFWLGGSVGRMPLRACVFLFVVLYIVLCLDHFDTRTGLPARAAAADVVCLLCVLVVCVASW